MTQIAIVQPAAPKIPPAGPPASGDKQQFSSHFDKAVSNRKDHLKTLDNDSGNSSRKLNDNEGLSTAPKNSAEGNGPIADPPQANETSGTVPVESLDEMAGQNLADGSLRNEIPAETPFFFISVNVATPTGEPANRGKEAVLPFARVLSQGLTASLPPQTESAESIVVPDETAAGSTTPQNGQKSAADALLLQIQQIINNSGEKGVVTIARVNPAPPTTINDGRAAQIVVPPPAANSLGQIYWGLSSEFPDSRPEAPAFVVTEGYRLPTEKSDAQPASLRQNTQQQYFEAKINLQSNNQEDSTPQQNKQQSGEPGTSGPSISAAAGTNSTAQPLLGEQANTFGQTLAAVQSSPTLPTSESAKTITLPSGIVVHEEDVVRQVFERFQISRRSFDTQINIKLHPAELGELKIDLSVKEGSIRANVVAQSQHAQEIIEKNMIKLKTILEDQGFTIDKITVTSKFDSTGDAGLFDRQLFGQDDYTPQSNKRRNNAETGFRLEDALIAGQPAATGVNVKI